jgi:hypothetical protein
MAPGIKFAHTTTVDELFVIPFRSDVGTNAGIQSGLSAGDLQGSFSGNSFHHAYMQAFNTNLSVTQTAPGLYQPDIYEIDLKRFQTSATPSDIAVLNYLDVFTVHEWVGLSDVAVSVAVDRFLFKRDSVNYIVQKFNIYQSSARGDNGTPQTVYAAGEENLVYPDFTDGAQIADGETQVHIDDFTLTLKAQYMIPAMSNQELNIRGLIKYAI